LGWVDNDYQTAKEFGELATRLMTETFHSPSEQSVFYLMIGSSIRHWFKHLRFGTQDYKDAYEIGVQSGNMQYAAYAFGHNMYCRFYQGVPLAGLISETEQSLEFSRTRLNRWAIDLLEGGLSIFASLSGVNHTVNETAPWSEEKYLLQLNDHHNIQVECIYKVLRTFSYLMLGQFDRALISSEEAEPLIYTVGTQGLLPWPEHVFARFLILTALYSKTDKKQQSKWRTELDHILSKLRIWADNCPDNFEHKYLLASAELARIDFKQLEAMQLYDKAIETAQEGHFHQWEGMANERAFNFMVETGNEQLAHNYFQQAYVCYKRLGAETKVNLMEMDYRIYLENNLSGNSNSGKSTNKHESEFLNVVIDKQIQHLRNYAFQLQQNGLQLEIANQADEMAHATQRLRVEIAERKSIENALRESENKFRLLYTSMDQGMALHEIITDADGKPIDYIFLDINDSYTKLLGVTREMSIGKRIKEVMPNVEQYWIDFFGKVALTGESSYYENYLETTGKYYSTHSYSPKKNQFAVLVSDITERKQAESDIKLINEELQKTNAEKDKFFSIIAHDLKSPFNSIIGLSEFIVVQLREKQFNEVEKYADIIVQSSHKVMDLLSNLMEWSRSQTGRMEFNPEYFELVVLIKDTDLLLSGAMEQKSISLSKSVPSNVSVYADKKM
ncbi:MAG: PAS domain S-box protein, partial [Prolixibacteraceae bacterium]|nr:PAS domain S-box protein [Prolixibacteraceae bacterium]